VLLLVRDVPPIPRHKPGKSLIGRETRAMLFRPGAAARYQ